MANEYYLLETSLVDHYQLEDGSGSLLLEIFSSTEGVDRTMMIAFDSRTSIVEVEPRTTLIPFESRTLVVVVTE